MELVMEVVAWVMAGVLTATAAKGVLSHLYGTRVEFDRGAGAYFFVGLAVVGWPAVWVVAALAFVGWSVSVLWTISIS